METKETLTQSTELEKHNPFSVKLAPVFKEEDLEEINKEIEFHKDHNRRKLEKKEEEDKQEQWRQLGLRILVGTYGALNTSRPGEQNLTDAKVGLFKLFLLIAFSKPEAFSSFKKFPH